MPFVDIHPEPAQLYPEPAQLYPKPVASGENVTATYAAIVANMNLEQAPTKKIVVGNFLPIYICNFHVLNHFLLIYICKFHWN